MHTRVGGAFVVEIAVGRLDGPGMASRTIDPAEMTAHNFGGPRVRLAPDFFLISDHWFQYGTPVWEASRQLRFPPEHYIGIAHYVGGLIKLNAEPFWESGGVVPVSSPIPGNSPGWSNDLR